MAHKVVSRFALSLALSLPGGLALAGEGGTAAVDGPNNLIPPGYVLPDTHAAENEASLARKRQAMEQLEHQPAAAGPTGELGTSPVLLSVSGVDQKPCNGYCAQASTQEIFHYKGQWGYSLDQIRTMETGLTDGCYDSSGTCITPIRDTLNAHTPGLPYAGFYAIYHLDNSSLYNAASNLQSITRTDISTYAMPLVALVNPNPPDGTPYCLPGWCGGSTGVGHYLVINGYEGSYDGSDGSAAIWYVDSWVNPADQHWANTNNFADCIKYKNGDGSCSPPYDIVW
jgi:hypothetical protein